MTTPEVVTVRRIIEDLRPHNDFFTFTEAGQRILVNSLFTLRYYFDLARQEGNIIVGARRCEPIEREKRIKEGSTSSPSRDTQPASFQVRIDTNPERRLYIGKGFPFRVSCTERSTDQIKIRIEGKEPIVIQDVTNLPLEEILARLHLA